MKINKVFLVTYNTSLTFNKVTFHDYVISLSKNGYISDWWHYIDNVYLVVTTSEVNNLYNAIYPGVRQQNLFIVEIDPNNAQGWLPRNAWSWLEKYRRK